MKRRRTNVAAALVISGLVAMPLFLGPGAARVGSLFCLTLVSLVGLHVVTGLTKVVSLSHAAFVGVGAYGAAIVCLRWGVAPPLAILVGTISAAACSLFLAVLTTRLGDHYLALGTLAAGEIILNVFRGATSLTGGANGLVGVAPLGWFGVILDTPMRYYPFCVVVGIGALAFAWRLDRSDIGRSLRAIGDEGLLVESIGISSARLRVIGFTIGGALGGLAGAIGAHIDGFVGPESYGVGLSIAYLCFLVIGGLGRLQGVWLGAALASLGPDLFRGLYEWQMILVALLSLALLVLRATRPGIRRAFGLVWRRRSDFVGNRT